MPYPVGEPMNDTDDRIRDEVNWVLDIIFSGQVRYKE
jgi:hypothetical protein